MPAPPHDAFDYESALARCARGEHPALAELYQRECAWLLGVAMRIVRERSRAEDALHDAFLRIWTRAASFDPAQGSARGWIYSVVRHTALNQVRDGAREVTLDEESAMATEVQHAVEQYRQAWAPAELRGDLGHLQHCLDALPAERRDCILFAYVEGCSHGEIAQRTGTPLGTVKAWLQRGMKALRECMA
ncbi:MAG: sigma-70 family RNA polymerase sigma factor [Burkholderiales bacterium]|jgi:RNA polymerase sigma-70 factor (ECF subfamily)|nr:sigma-70 family RNA polymerase sigma factor [Burkholderiales bacterium]